MLADSHLNKVRIVTCLYIRDDVQYVMKIDWDENKNISNANKHGLHFEDARIVFAGECLTFEDDRFDYGERRLITMGELDGRAVVVVHTPRGDKTRIISMRKANEREKRIYQERSGKA